MKKLNLLKTMLLIALMLLGSANVWGQKTYELVASNTQLVAGKKYLIMSKNATNVWQGMGLMNTANSPSRFREAVSSGVTSTTPPASFTITPETVSTGLGIFEFELGGNSSAWTFYDGVTPGYLDQPSNANYLGTVASTGTTTGWTISVNAITNVATITSTRNSSYTLQKNTTDSNGFRTYTSAQHAVYLYVENTCTTPSTVTLIDRGVQIDELVQTDCSEELILPSPTGCGAWTFAGWKADSEQSSTTTRPTGLIPAGEYTPDSNITLYAVYEKNSDGESNIYTLVTDISQVEDGKKYIISAARNSTTGFQYALQLSTTTNTQPQAAITINGTDIDITTTDATAWTLTARDGSFKTFSNDGNYLYSTSGQTYLRARTDVTTDCDYIISINSTF